MRKKWHVYVGRTRDSNSPVSVSRHGGEYNTKREAVDAVLEERGGKYSPILRVGFDTYFVIPRKGVA